MEQLRRCSILLIALLAVSLTLLPADPAMSWTLRWERYEPGLSCTGAAGVPGGGIYVVGYCVGPPRMAFLRRYSPSGEVLWTREILEGMTWEAAVAPDGSVYVIGDAYGLSTIWWARYSKRGRLLGKWTLPTPAGSSSSGRAIAVDGDGSVFLAGYKNHGHPRGDMWIGKRSPSGSALWSRRFIGWAFEKLAAASDGSVYAVGQETGDDDYLKFVVRKLSADGTILWKGNEDLADGTHIHARAAVVGPDDELYVAGSHWRPLLAEEGTFWMRKYSPNGIVRWTDESEADTHGSAATLSPGGAIIVAGGIYDPDTSVFPQVNSFDLFLGRFSRDGVLRHQERRDDGINRVLTPDGVAVDSDGSVYVAGTASGGPTGTTLFVLKYR